MARSIGKSTARAAILGTLFAVSLGLSGAAPAAAAEAKIKVKIPAGSGLNIVNGYGSLSGRYGRPWDSGQAIRHHGLDFAAEPGTAVISASFGEIAWLQPNKCSGYDIAVKTTIRASRTGKGATEPVFAIYSHAKPMSNLSVGDQVRPGDQLGRVIPLLGTPCYTSKPHVHFELRFNNRRALHTSPHRFWVAGPGQVTCFRDGMTVPHDKIVAPLRCNEPSGS